MRTITAIVILMLLSHAPSAFASTWCDTERMKEMLQHHILGSPEYHSSALEVIANGQQALQSLALEMSSQRSYWEWQTVDTSDCQAGSEWELPSGIVRFSLKQMSLVDPVWHDSLTAGIINVTGKLEFDSIHAVSDIRFQKQYSYQHCEVKSAADGAQVLLTSWTGERILGERFETKVEAEARVELLKADELCGFAAQE